MGGHSRICPSLRWACMDGERMARRYACKMRGQRVLRALYPCTVEFCCPAQADLTPQRRLVYDASTLLFLWCTQRRRNVTWQAMH